MSARKVFQHAFAHAELTRPPDYYTQDSITDVSGLSPETRAALDQWLAEPLADETEQAIETESAEADTYNITDFSGLSPETQAVLIESLADETEPTNGTNSATVQPVRPSNYWSLDPTAQPF